MFPLLLIQTIGLSLTWSIIALRIPLFFVTILILLLLILVQYIVLETFVFGWNEKVKIYDTVLCGVPEEKRSETIRNIYFIALATSWITPVTVWCNNRPSSIIKQKRGIPDKTKYFLIVSSATTIIYLFFVLVILEAFFPALQSDCEKESLYFERFFLCHFVYLKFISILVVTFICSICLWFLSDWDIFQKRSYWLQIRHCTVLQDNINVKILKSNWTQNELQLNDISQLISPIAVNEPDIISGNANLHFAFQKGLYNICIKILNCGGDPLQRNNNGESVYSLISKEQKMESFKTRCWTWTGETFFLEMNSNNNDGKWIAFASDIGGKIHWSMKVNDPEDLLIAKCMLQEAKMLIEVSEKIEGDNILAKQLHGLRMHASSLRNDFLEFKEEFLKYIMKIKIENATETIPLLHKVLKGKQIILYDCLIFLGANAETKNNNLETALEAEIQIFLQKRKEKEEKEKDNKFIWNILKRGGIRYVKGKEDIFYVLNTFFCKKKYGGKLKSKYSDIFFLDVVKHFDEYCAKNWDENGAKILTYFLDIGCSLSTYESNDSNMQTILHIAAQKPTGHCLKTLLVIIELII